MKVAKLLLEKNKLAAQLQQKTLHSFNALTPRAIVKQTSQDMLHSNQAKNLGERSKSLASLVIHKLKRRVSFRGRSGLGQSRPSFHMRSHANASIYKISESSNESPEKHSSNKPQRKRTSFSHASVNNLNRYEDNYDTTLLNKG